MATITIIYNSDARRVSGITRTTTCDDVINVLLRNTGSHEKENAFSFAIFESVGGIERLLPRNTRLLQLQNSWGHEIENVKFVLRKSQCHGLVPKISIAKRKRLYEKRKPVSQSVDGSRQCPNISSSVSERKERARLLLQFTQIQKTKIQKNKDKITGLDKGLNKFRLGFRFKKFTHAKTKSVKDETFEVDSMDEFLANVDEDNMEDLLNFCDKVAGQELSRLTADAGCSDKQSDVSTKVNNTEEDCSVDILEEKLKEVQHALHKFPHSTRTIQKSGFDNTMEADVLQNKIISRQKTCHFLINNIVSLDGSSKTQAKSATPGVHIIPMHSTPICGRAMPRTSRDGDDRHRIPRDLNKCLPTGRTGKSFLVQKCLKQQASPAKNLVANEEYPTRDNIGSDTYTVTSKIIKSPKFNTLQERSKFYWDMGCNSDSDSDSGGSNASCDHDFRFMDSLPFSPTHSGAEHSLMSNHAVFSYFESPSIIEPSTRSFDKSIHCGKQLVDYSIGSEDSYDGTTVTVSNLPGRTCNRNKAKYQTYLDSDTGLGGEGNISCKIYLV
ncbi:hypothetical protein ACJMK2_020706 [Sinanodonta woodiana]|uniref:Ras-associating domain-containing protein n=1 Tax=Sinanodonta woodiana TaxID=1069815 RepID=A0ABD3U3C4_SINWO